MIQFHSRTQIAANFVENNIYFTTHILKPKINNMKKNFLSVIVLAFVISISSCKSSSSSFDSDVRKMADYRCQLQQLMAKDPSDEKAKKELEELSVKVKAYGDEMGKKYEKMKDDKDMEAKADAIMKEVMDKCK